MADTDKKRSSKKTFHNVIEYATKAGSGIQWAAATIGALGSIAGVFVSLKNLLSKENPEESKPYSLSTNTQELNRQRQLLTYDQVYGLLSNPDELRRYIDFAMLERNRLMETDPMRARRIGDYVDALKVFEAYMFGGTETLTEPPIYQNRPTVSGVNEYHRPELDTVTYTEPQLDQVGQSLKLKKKKPDLVLKTILFISLLTILYLPFSNLTSTAKIVSPTSSSLPFVVGLFLIAGSSLFFLIRKRSHVS